MQNSWRSLAKSAMTRLANAPKEALAVSVEWRDLWCPSAMFDHVNVNVQECGVYWVHTKKKFTNSNSFWMFLDHLRYFVKINQNYSKHLCRWMSLVFLGRREPSHLNTTPKNAPLSTWVKFAPRISVLNRQLCLQSGPLFSKEGLRRYHGPVIHLPLPCCFCLAMPISTFNRSLPLAAGRLCFTREWFSCWLRLHLIKLFVYLYHISCNLSSLSRVGQHHFLWPPQRCFMSPPGKSLGTGTRPGGPSMSDTFQAHPAKTYHQRMLAPWHRSKEGAGDEATKLWCENMWCIWWDWDVIFRMYLRINESCFSDPAVCLTGLFRHFPVQFRPLAAEVFLYRDASNTKWAQSWVADWKFGVGMLAPYPDQDASRKLMKNQGS